MRVEILTDIADVFSVFHDGGIVNACHEQGSVSMEIEIPYLAEMISSIYTKFKVRLNDFSNAEFLLWLNEAGAVSEKMHGTGSIFDADVEILKASAVGKRVALTFNQYDPTLNYSGGELYFSASSIDIQDESGRLCSVKELRELSAAYWKSWALRNGGGK